jgi:hypothetical protein
MVDPFPTKIPAKDSEFSGGELTVILFGSNNPSGAAFLYLSRMNPPEIWGRRPAPDTCVRHIYCDLTEFSSQYLRKIDGVLVSFAPIWLLAPFLDHLLTYQPGILMNLKGIVACSSSSFMTKRFAFNTYDKELALRLEDSHQKLKYIAQRLNIPYQILAPTLVYGQVNNYSDKNLSQIIKLLRLLPVMFLPKTTGLRQPIHAMQLASVARRQADKMLSDDWPDEEPEIVALGGDSTMSYKEMIFQIQNNLQHGDAGLHCRIIIVPDRLFFILVAPILPVNPKIFEAIMRIKSDLSNFKPAHKILNEEPKTFPILPLDSMR